MKLIDKDALVAEIERLKNTSLEYGYNTMQNILADSGKDLSLGQLQNFINSLEVKEVDLEKEIDRVWDNTSDNFSEDGWKEFEEIAKHFFKLGKRVDIPITAADRDMAEEIIINLKRIEQDYRIDLTKEMEWLRKKAQEGE